MNDSGSSVHVRRFALSDIAPGGVWHEPFVTLQSPWTGRGVRRWLGLLRPDARRPVQVAGAWATGSEEELVGSMVGVWHPTVLDRFDDLFDPDRSPGLSADDHPTHGCWHFISVTISPGWQGLGIGRRMVREALGRLASATPDVVARTLSPALGLAERLGTTDASEVSADVLRAAVHELAIVRFHCANGARLDAILPGSRSDDLASAQVNLRFAYELTFV